MNELQTNERLDFISVLGQEFCIVFSSIDANGQIVPQDGYEAWMQSFDSQPSLEAISNLSKLDIERLRQSCIRILEIDNIDCELIGLWIESVRKRWQV